MTLRFVRFWLSMLLILFTAHLGVGQSVYATIRGTVNDPSGAVLPSVQVVATNTATGVVYNTTTQSNGSYQFLQLPVGTYVVSASKNQFKNFKTNPITLTLNQSYTLP